MALKPESLFPKGSFKKYIKTTKRMIHLLTKYSLKYTNLIKTYTSTIDFIHKMYSNQFLESGFVWNWFNCTRYKARPIHNHDNRIIIKSTSDDGGLLWNHKILHTILVLWLCEFETLVKLLLRYAGPISLKILQTRTN